MKGIALLMMFATGCQIVPNPASPDISLIMPPPVPEYRRPSVSEDESQASEDVPEERKIRLSWDSYDDASETWEFQIYYSPALESDATWLVVTNAAWPVNSVTLNPTNGFYRITIKNNEGIESK